MKQLRRAGERGHADHGWLDTWHTFSFAHYHDPGQMGWGALRVINDDRIAPGTGFGTHGHRDMEILTYVLEGVLEHRDSMGNGTQIRAGEVQRMSAGRGVTHSEFNPSTEAPVRLLQIWIEPSARGVAPGYAQKAFPADARRGRLCLIASGDGHEGSVSIRQDAAVYAGLVDGDEAAAHDFAPGRFGYLHVVRGTLCAAGISLGAGDGLKLRDESRIELTDSRECEFLLFDLPPGRA